MEQALGISYKEQQVVVNGESKIRYIPNGDYRVSRYADDFLVFAQSKEDIDKVPELLQPYL